MKREQIEWNLRDAFPQEPQEGLIRDAQTYIEHSLQYLPETNHTEYFPAGQRVRHAMFGPGTILEVDPDRGAYSIQFDAMETPRKISFRAKLEPCSPV